MKILVTGAGGFVGKRLVRRLADAGHDITAVVRAQPASADRPYFASPRVYVLELDLARLDASRLPRGIEAVCSLAQSSRFRDFPAHAEEVFAVNVTANLVLLQWAIGAGVKRVVHASSGGIYGGRKGGQFLETDLLAVDSPLGFYLGTKLCAELTLQNYRQFFGTTAILRPFFIYGPGQRPDMFIARLVKSIRAGRPVTLQGRDGLRVNPVYVDDAVEHFAAALGLDGTHVLNVAGPDVLTLRQICDLIGRLLGRTPVYEMAAGEPVDYVGDLSRTRDELKIDLCTPFEQGIARTVQHREPR